MNIPGKAVSSALILFGLGWLATLFFNPNTWVNRSANQMNGTAQTGVGTQNFTTKGAVPLVNGNQTTLDQTAIAPQSTQRQPVRQQPQSLNSPDQSVQATPPYQPTIPASPQPALTPAAVVTPSPRVVAEPVQAGW
jgi:hypothetical protein